jgi:hypothetical protein
MNRGGDRLPSTFGGYELARRVGGELPSDSLLALE